MWSEDLIHGSIIGRSGVLQPEGHHDVTIYPQWHPEGCMILVTRVHFSLIIAREPIHEGHVSK